MAEGELRQRRGEADQATQDAKDEEIARLRAELEASRKKTEATTEEEKAKQFIQEVNDSLEKNKPGTVRGLSNQAKAYKEKLEKDPMNMELIFQLGIAYAVDQQWEKSVNVLLRGWKRVDEFTDAAIRTEFRMCLSQGSEKIGKYRQALAVIADAEDIDEPEEQRGLEVLRCKVYCANGDTTKALQALNRALEGLPFDKAAGLWANLVTSLKKVGAYDISKSSLLALASEDEKGRAQETVEAMEKLVAYKDAYYATGEPTPLSSSKKYAMGGVAAVLFFIMMYCLYLLEHASLSKMELKK